MRIEIFQKGFNYSQDGEGNRLVYHFCGCNMRCMWCANPEGFAEKGGVLSPNGSPYTPVSLAAEAISCKAMFFDGGDKVGRKQEIFVLFQPEFFIDALFESVRTFVVKLARENNIQRRFSRIASHPVISP